MKQSDEKLWDLFMNEETIPSKEQMNKWDEEISTVMSEKVKYERLLNNLSLLMALRGIKTIRGLASLVGYDSAHISNIFNGSIRTRSNVVCFYIIAHKLQVKLTTLLRVNLADELQAVIKKHESN